MPSTFCMLLQERLKKLKKEHGKKELGTVTLDMTIGGMRGIPVKEFEFHMHDIILLLPLLTRLHVKLILSAVSWLVAFKAQAMRWSKISHNIQVVACRACCGRHRC